MRKILRKFECWLLGHSPILSGTVEGGPESSCRRCGLCEYYNHELKICFKYEYFDYEETLPIWRRIPIWIQWRIWLFREYYLNEKKKESDNAINPDDLPF